MKKKRLKKVKKTKTKTSTTPTRTPTYVLRVPEEKRGINSKRLTLKQNIINLSKVKDIENLGNATLYM